MKRFILIIVCITLFLPLKAQNDFEITNHEISLSLEIPDEDLFMIYANYNYMFCDYLGAGCAIGYWSEFGNDGLISFFSNESDDNDKLSRLFIMPGIKLYTPYFIKTNQVKFNIFSEVGYMINRKFTRTIVAYKDEEFMEKEYFSFTGGRTSLHFTSGLNIKFETVGLGLGYSYSTLEYTKNVDFSRENPLYRKNINGLLYLMLSIRF
ncbi:MAG: hypothetical protein MJ211_08555 [Bacteroidales bacterium]|nr:hypothetical protein [Bacteroidales bacterium]